MHIPGDFDPAAYGNIAVQHIPASGGVTPGGVTGGDQSIVRAVLYLLIFIYIIDGLIFQSIGPHVHRLHGEDLGPLRQGIALRQGGGKDAGGLVISPGEGYLLLPSLDVLGQRRFYPLQALRCYGRGQVQLAVGGQYALLIHPAPARNGDGLRLVVPLGLVGLSGKGAVVPVGCTNRALVVHRTLSALRGTGTYGRRGRCGCAVVLISAALRRLACAGAQIRTRRTAHRAVGVPCTLRALYGASADGNRGCRRWCAAAALAVPLTVGRRGISAILLVHGLGFRALAGAEIRTLCGADGAIGIHAPFTAFCSADAVRGLRAAFRLAFCQGRGGEDRGHQQRNIQGYCNHFLFHASSPLPGNFLHRPPPCGRKMQKETPFRPGAGRKTFPMSVHVFRCCTRGPGKFLRAVAHGSHGSFSSPFRAIIGLGGNRPAGHETDIYSL